MGCFYSKQKDLEASVDISVSQESDGLGIAPFVATQNDNILSFSSSSSESSSDCESPQVRPRYNLIEKLAVGIHNLNASELAGGVVPHSISDDSSIEPAPDDAAQNISDDSSIESSSLLEADGTSFSNQSMIEGDENESVVDWLATSTTSVMLTSTSTRKDKSKHVLGPLSMANNNESTNHEDVNNKHVVKDTSIADRRHMPLPSNKPPSITQGSWLSNRYVINEYIVLSEIGKGGHAEVRLAKHRTTNELFAIKISNRKLLETKVVDLQNEINIMKSMQHKNVLRLYEVIDDPKGMCCICQMN